MNYQNQRIENPLKTLKAREVHFPVKFMVVFQKNLTENELIWKHFSQDILIDSSVYEIFKICFILQERYQEKVFGKK